MTRSDEVLEEGAEPLLDLQRLAAGIRWRRRSWLCLAMVGVLSGVALALLLPSRSTAITRIYVVHEDEGSGAQESKMQTDLALLESTTVAAVALDRLRVTLPPERFASEYAGEVVASNILEISTRGSNDAQAVERARAVAEAYIAVHVQRSDDAASADVQALTARRSEVEKDLAEVNTRITEASGQPGEAAQLESLFGRRSSLTSQIDDLAQRAENASLGFPRVAAGTQIIDAPHATTRSPLVSTVLFGAVGLILGLGLGLAFAAVATVARDRPVLRRDIAAHLGASVIAQLPAPIRGPRRLWKGRRANSERRRAAATLVRAVREGKGPVSVLELGCARTAARLARDIADELALERPVVLIDDLPGKQLRRLSGAPDSAVRVVAGVDYPPVPPTTPERREQRLGVGTVGPGTPWTDLRRLGAETLLVVRAGSAGTAWLHTVARQLADAGIAIIGIVVEHPDPRDRSDGTLWDALHTAIRGRLAAGSSAVPTEKIATGSDQQAPAPNGVAVDERVVTAARTDRPSPVEPDRPAPPRSAPSPRPTSNGSARDGTSSNGGAQSTDKFPPVVAATPVHHPVEAT